MSREIIDYRELPKILDEFILRYTIVLGENPTALYLGSQTVRHLKHALVNETPNKQVSIRIDRDYYKDIPIYIVDCENYIAVGQ